MSKKVVRIVLSCIALVSAVYAQTVTNGAFKFATINFPGAFATNANGVNVNGEIVGSYLPTSSGPTRGFMYLNGKFTKVNIAGSTSTSVNGVNDLGDMVGTYNKSDNSIHGFLIKHTGITLTLDFNGAGAPTFPHATLPYGVNDQLTICGSILATGTNYSPSGGFVWANGKFNYFPTILGNPAGLFGISNNGVLVGQVFFQDFWHPALKAGTDSDIYPTYQARDSVASGVNRATDIVGSAIFSQGFFARHVELNEGSNDQEVTPGYLLVQYPGASTTTPNGISDNQSIVGTYGDSTGTHGFLAVLQ